MGISNRGRDFFSGRHHSRLWYMVWLMALKIYSTPAIIFHTRDAEMVRPDGFEPPTPWFEARTTGYSSGLINIPKKPCLALFSRFIGLQFVNLYSSVFPFIAIICLHSVYSSVPKRCDPLTSRLSV